MASISSGSFNDSTVDTVSDTHPATSGSVPNRPIQFPRTLQDRRDRIEFWLGAWEAVSFPCLYPSEQVVALEAGSSFTERCKAWNPGRPLDENAPWLLSTVVIPARDEEGPVASLFAGLPEVPRTASRRRDFAHKILFTLTHSPAGSLTKLLTIPRLIRKCVAALGSLQRYNIASLKTADLIDLRLTLYRVSVAAVWQRTQHFSQRISIVYHHILPHQQKVVLVLSNVRGAFFTRLLDLTFDQILYSAQESIIFEPLFEEDGHGFQSQPMLKDIDWNED